MEYIKLNKIIALGLICITTLAIFISNFFIPLGFSIWALFIIPLAITHIVFGEKYLIRLVTLFSVLIAVNLFFAPRIIPFEYAVFNRSMGILMFYIIAYSLVYINKSRKINIDLLLHHSYFKRIDSIINCELKSRNFGSDFKNELYRDIIHYRMLYFKKSMVETINNINSSYIPESKLKEYILFKLHDGRDRSFEELYEREGFTEEDKEVIRIALTVFDDIKSSSLVKLLESTLESIIKSDIYKNNAILLFSYLTPLVDIIDTWYNTVEFDLKGVDNQLRNKKYHNIKF